AFTCQLSALLAMALQAAQCRGTISDDELREIVEQMGALPARLREALLLGRQIKDIARQISGAKDVLYLGRGTSYPLALEGTLKLKESSNIKAEASAAGELKHGPIALVDEDVPVFVIAPSDDVLEKTLPNVQEVAARGGRIVMIGDERSLATAGVSPFAS